MNTNPGPNSTCTCGSGRKFKKCCGNVAHIQNRRVLRRTTPEELRTMKVRYKAMQAKDEIRRDKFGDVKPLVHCDWQAQGKQVVAIGNVLCIGDFDSFPEFLWMYLLEVVGKDWLIEQMHLEPLHAHPIAQWLWAMQVFAGPGGDITKDMHSSTPQNATLSLMLLANDIYTIRNNGQLQDEMINRLRNGDFGTARYELTVAAAVMRAGLKIDFEDEFDTTRPHPEFIATDPTSGIQIAVEAKSKKDATLVGFNGRWQWSQSALRLQSRVKKAVKKQPKIPYLIFVDLNLPPEMTMDPNGEWLKAIASEAIQIDAMANPLDEFNAVFVTNTGLHYYAAMSRPATAICMPILAKNPKYPLPDVRIIALIQDAFKKFNNYPRTFDEAV